MLSIKVNQNNDFMLDDNNNIALVSGPDAVLQNTVTAMKAQLGEMPFARLQGMPTLRTAWENLDIDGFEANARRVITRVPGVLAVREFEASQDGDVLNYTASIDTIYGNQTIGGVIG